MTAYEEMPAEYRYIMEQLWPPEEWENCAAVMKCESGFNPCAHAGGPPCSTEWWGSGEDSRGLMQLNVQPSLGRSAWAAMDLYDPSVNMQLAYNRLWVFQGWGPWSCATLLGITAGGTPPGPLPTDGGIEIPTPVGSISGLPAALVVIGVGVVILAIAGRRG